MPDTSRPHMAILNVIIEVHMLDDLGQCSGKIVKPEILKKYSIKPSLLLDVNGIDLEDCLQKLQTKIKEFHNE